MTTLPDGFGTAAQDCVAAITAIIDGDADTAMQITIATKEPERMLWMLVGALIGARETLAERDVVVELRAYWRRVASTVTQALIDEGHTS